MKPSLNHHDEVCEWVDVQGLHCPMPLLKAKQALRRRGTGELVGVIATDAGAMRDIPAFCKMVGHEVHICEERDQDYLFIIEKGAEQA